MTMTSAFSFLIEALSCISRRIGAEPNAVACPASSPPTRGLRCTRSTSQSATTSSGNEATSCADVYRAIECHVVDVTQFASVLDSCYAKKDSVPCSRNLSMCVVAASGRIQHAFRTAFGCSDAERGRGMSVDGASVMLRAMQFADPELYERSRSRFAIHRKDRYRAQSTLRE